MSKERLNELLDDVEKYDYYPYVDGQRVDWIEDKIRMLSKVVREIVNKLEEKEDE